MPAFGAGGHHAVDDATLVDEGFCQVETWREYEHGRTLLHEGPACRIGNTEVGLNFDQQGSRNGADRRGQGAQVKFATAFEGPLNVAVVLGAYRWTDPDLSSVSLLVPVTWQITPSLAAHINWGRSWNRNSRDYAQEGLALEWTANAQWQLLAEWFSPGPASYRRAGIRYVINEAWAWDVSYATSRGVPWWTTGLTWTFAR